jgi:hypothetical protein
LTPDIISSPAGYAYYGEERSSEPDAFRMSHVQPAHYGVAVRNSGAGCYLKEVRLDRQVQADGFLVTPEMNTAKLDLYLSSKVAHCRIHVVDRDHHPVGLFSVVLLEQLGNRYVVRRPYDSVEGTYWNVPGHYLLAIASASAFRNRFQGNHAGLISRI